MIRVYFINLLASVERRSWFEAQADGLGLSATRIEACSGRELAECDLSHCQSQRLSDIWMGPAEVGCFLSHRKTWKKIQEEADPWAFVAEDDLHLAADCGPFFEESEWIPDSADLIKAETTFKKCHRELDAASKHTGRNVHRLLSLHGGAGGYFVSKSAAKMLVEACDGFCEPADHVLFNPAFGLFDKLQVFQIEPAFGLQDIFFKHRIPGFEKSTLAVERKSQKKPDSYTRLRRELARPFLRLWQELDHRLHSVRYGTNYSSVQYRDQDTVRLGARTL